jgi:methylated-DNA-protein-cysteine methyltransferase related protein
VTNFERRVRRAIARLRPGEVATYGEIAEEAGFPGAARAVGGILARSEGLPWWRVVTAQGRLVPGHEREHIRRLAAEGVRVSSGRVAAAPKRSRPTGGISRPEGGVPRGAPERCRWCPFPRLACPADTP